MKLIAWLFLGMAAAWAHDAHGRSTAPPEALRLTNPLAPGQRDAALAARLYEQHCGGCHGVDGRSMTPLAGKLKVRPTNLANYLMESMKDGEIYWVVTHGIGASMPAFHQLPDDQRWQLVGHVRALRAQQRAIEKARLGSYDWKLPPGFPLPNVPPDNPMTAAKVTLGRHLFYDQRLSLNQTQSCASCHKQELAFTDGRPRGIGSTKEKHPRGAMSLANMAYTPILTWANPNLRRLETQALAPLFGDHPVELGMAGKEDLMAERLKADARYRKMFAEAFPEQPEPFNLANITKAIASFERTLLSGDSPFDRYRNRDDAHAIPPAAKRGEALFFSERLECFHCHGGFNLTGSVDYLDKGFVEVEFHNTGLYRHYESPNTGLEEFTHDEEDNGKFRAPTLRNIAVTAPYMHDGGVATLEAAVDHYAKGGRGGDHPAKSEFIKSFDLTAQEKRDLVEFLRSLTDQTFLRNPQFGNPWPPAKTTATQRPTGRKGSTR